MPEKLTPAQQQYWDMKQKHKDAILFFRMGDFYEMFGEDALLVSKVLGLTLTSRDKSSENPVPMAGVPYHAVNKYVAMLSRQGYKIAICEQMSDASLPGIVERGVVRIITPGTVVEDDMLDREKNNYLVCIAEKNNAFGFSYIDTSTGDFFVTELADMEKVKDELGKLSPSEIIFPKGVFASVDFVDFVKKTYRCSTSFYEMFEDPAKILLEQFHVKTLKGFGIEDFSVGIISCGYLISYVKENEKAPLLHVTKVIPYFLTDYMQLDETTIRNLELLSNNYNHKREGSLLSILDKTQTSMGARLLFQWIIRPLLSREKIEERLEAVDYFVHNKKISSDMRDVLKNVSDVERIVGKIVLRKASPRDIIALKATIRSAASLPPLFLANTPPLIQKRLQQCSAEKLHIVYDLIEKAIDENASSPASEGNIIKQGYHADIDALRSVVYEGKDWLLAYQDREQKRTNITTLKVKYNKIFGYFIEVSKGQVHKIPSDFIRKQTLVNAERYITPELKEYEDKVSGAEEKLFALERAIFEDVQAEILQHVVDLKAMAYSLAVLDVLHSFAFVAAEYKYTKPQITTEKGSLLVKEGRHPVVENLIEEGFIGNDLHLDKQQRIILLTGPNMAGKSTYLRQNALIILLAQIGSFVPAESCVLDVVERIFTRIGASDVLVKGQSTFLVEMQEAANILNNATEKSFIILDEVGRGTSTYDGLSLAWSILEYLHHNTKAKVLFATHYHELISVAEELSGASNFSMAVTERSDGVVFLRKVVAGGTDKSYGIEVAKISGLPSSVIERAKVILHSLETKKQGHAEKRQMSFLEPLIIETMKVVEKKSPLMERLEQVDVDNMTPLEALSLLHEIKKGRENT